MIALKRANAHWPTIIDAAARVQTLTISRTMRRMLRLYFRALMLSASPSNTPRAFSSSSVKSSSSFCGLVLSGVLTSLVAVEGGGVGCFGGGGVSVLSGGVACFGGGGVDCRSIGVCSGSGVACFGGGGGGVDCRSIGVCSGGGVACFGGGGGVDCRSIGVCSGGGVACVVAGGVDCFSAGC